MTQRMLAVSVWLLLLAGTAHGQATVVKDHLCGLFDAQGNIQDGAFGLSTLAPNGVVHLVCTATVPAPGIPLVLDPSIIPSECLVEYRLATTWIERTSPRASCDARRWPEAGPLAAA